MRHFEQQSHAYGRKTHAYTAELLPTTFENLFLPVLSTQNVIRRSY